MRWVRGVWELAYSRGGGGGGAGWRSGLKGDVHQGLRVSIRGLVSRGERAEGDCEGTIDRVGSRMCANGLLADIVTRGRVQGR